MLPHPLDERIGLARVSGLSRLRGESNPSWSMARNPWRPAVSSSDSEHQTRFHPPSANLPRRASDIDGPAQW